MLIKSPGILVPQTSTHYMDMGRLLWESEVAGPSFYVTILPGHRKAFVLCRCVKCSSLRVVGVSTLIQGKSKTCGCLGGSRLRHGFCRNGQRHPLHNVWNAMINRCYRKKTIAYPNYGGRGITVCAEWRADSAAFIRWSIANGWEPGLTIDRTNNDAGYSPNNCRFVTQAVNNRNQRPRKRRKRVDTLEDSQ